MPTALEHDLGVWADTDAHNKDLGGRLGDGKGEKCYFIREEVHKGFLMPAGLLWDVASVAQANEVT